ERKPCSLNPSQLAVLEVPVRVVEVREIVRVADILRRQPWAKPPRELEHLPLLELLHLVQQRDDATHDDTNVGGHAPGLSRPRMRRRLVEGAARRRRARTFQPERWDLSLIRRVRS